LSVKIISAGLESTCEEQKMKYLVPLEGRSNGFVCQARGRFRYSQKTTAIDKGDHYLLNGTKNWITNGSSALFTS
jgi:alkylation response protein AidB-like acyl-CoA dehydrogenase